LFLIHREQSLPEENDDQPSPVSAVTTKIATEAPVASPQPRPGPTNLPGNMAAAPEAPAGDTAGETPEEKQRAYVEARSSELMDLATNDDSDSLRTILSELTNRDPQIREAAVQAAIQFNSRDAIPALADAALQTDDPHEKAAIADAIEFLKLPSLGEAMAERKAAAPAPPDNSAGTNSSN
jgi:hypothetical protein